MESQESKRGIEGKIARMDPLLYSLGGMRIEEQ